MYLTPDFSYADSSHPQFMQYAGQYFILLDRRSLSRRLDC